MDKKLAKTIKEEMERQNGKYEDDVAGLVLTEDHWV